MAITIHGRDHLSGNMVQPCHDRGSLTKVARQLDDTDMLIFYCDSRKLLARLVGAAVVYKNDFVGKPCRVQSGPEAFIEAANASLLVVNGDDDR